MDNRFYTVHEIAIILRVKDRAITRLIRIGRIQAFRIGKGKRSHYRIPYSELERIQTMGFEETLKALRPLLEKLPS